jgi:hypothetical protein
MANITLTGLFKDSLGAVDVGAVITFTHETTTGETLATTKSEIVVSPSGAYTITLEYGQIRIDYTTRYTERFIATVIVNGDTTATSLPELLNAAVPVTPAVILQMQGILSDAQAAATTSESFANQLTTLGLIASTASFTTSTVINTSGYTASGDGGKGGWKQNGLTGQTPIRTPAQLGGLTLNDGNGNQWGLVTDGTVGLKEVGFIADAATDNIVLMLALLGNSALKVLKDDGGVYAFSDGFDIPVGKIIKGAGAPSMGPFPPPAAMTDDLIYMTAGYKDKIPGTSFLFTGTGTTSATTTRSDRFASGFSYGVRVVGRGAGRISDIGIIMDMNVFATFGGSVTSVAADSRSNYDVGLFLDGSTKGASDNVTVFGYWPVAGTVVYGGPVQADGGDPDYNQFFGGSTSGDIGLAIIGNETNGLSGTQLNGSKIYCNDHHSRSIVDNQWGTNALYIDGDLPANDTGINGHILVNCNIRSSVNNIIALDHCNNMTMIGGVIENPAVAGSTGATLAQWTGTANTGDVTIFGVRMTRDAITASLKTQMVGVLNWQSEYPTGAISVSRNNSGVRLVNDASTNDNLLQLANAPTSINSGWTLRRDASESDNLDIRYDNVSVGHITAAGRFILNDVSMTKTGVPFSALLTIAGGAVTLTGSRHKITAQGGPGADDLTNLVTTGFTAGDRLVLSTDNASDAITLKDSVVNLRMEGDFLMDSVFDRIELEYDGSNWAELNRANNG